MEHSIQQYYWIWSFVLTRGGRLGPSPTLDWARLASRQHLPLGVGGSSNAVQRQE